MEGSEEEDRNVGVDLAHNPWTKEVPDCMRMEGSDEEDRNDGVDLAHNPWTKEVPDCAVSLLPRSSPSIAAFAAGTLRGPSRQCSRVHGVWQEDQLIQQLVSVHGRREWAVIASQLPGRSGKQCRERFKIVCVDVVPRPLGEIVLDVLVQREIRIHGTLF